MGYQVLFDIVVAGIVASCILIVMWWAVTNTCAVPGCHTLCAPDILCEHHRLAISEHTSDTSEDEVVLPHPKELSEAEIDCLRGQAKLHAEYSVKTGNMWDQAGIPRKRAATILYDHGYNNVSTAILVHDKYHG